MLGSFLIFFLGGWETNNYYEIAQETENKITKIKGIKNIYDNNKEIKLYCPYDSVIVLISSIGIL